LIQPKSIAAQAHSFNSVNAPRRHHDRGMHLARDIGNPIQHSCRGTLTIDFGIAETELNVHWHRT
jgi:hypothetical protein